MHLGCLLCQKVQQNLVSKTSDHVQSKDDSSPVTVAEVQKFRSIASVYIRGDIVMNVQSSKYQVVLGEEIGHVRLMTLNQPRQLNAVSSDMFHLMAAFLEKWEKDNEAQLIIVKGSGRAFSGGGDLKSFYEARTLNDRGLGIPYKLYWLGYHIQTHRKTQVALVDGVAMGGGAALMALMEFSVVTENAVFAIPETAIGFHPDVGFSYMLSRLPGHLGEFLGLTGTRLNGKEIVAAGLATHFVPSEKLRELQNRLTSLNTGEVTVLRSDYRAANKPIISNSAN